MAVLMARPERLEIDCERTALIVVDMQNGFALKGGMLDLAGHDVSGAAPVIEANRRLINVCRKAGIQVIYLQMSFKPDLSDGGGPSSPNYHKELALRTMRERPELAGKLLVDNTWDWQIVDALKPQPGDIVVRKSRYSGFCRTHLDRHLQAGKIRYLLFAGIATNVCVESTARDAFFHEFWPILIEDAMAHAGPDFTRQATLWNFEHVFGWVTTVNNVLAVLQSKAIAATPA